MLIGAGDIPPLQVPPLLQQLLPAFFMRGVAWRALPRPGGEALTFRTGADADVIPEIADAIRGRYDLSESENVLAVPTARRVA